MSIFKKKKTEEEKPKAVDIKQQILEALNNKLQGTLYDDCVIMPKGYTVDIRIGRHEVTDEVHLLQVLYIVKNDDFDEPIIEPVDSQGKTDEDAVKMSVEIFFGGLWHPLNQSMLKKNPVHFSVDYLKQHYDFDMYAQSIVRIGQQNQNPTMLVNFVKSEIPKYLGSKKYYWLRIYLARFKEKRIVEVRINGTVCTELARYFKDYIESWPETDTFVSEKQYAIFVQHEDDKCPFKKELVTETAVKTIDLMENCGSPEEYKELVRKVEEMTGGDKGLAAEIRIFIPEILAKLTMGYNEGDSLFLIQDDSSIEIKKTQLRSYFYIQQVLLEYLQNKPEQDKVMRIVSNSAAFRELKKAHEQGHEPKDLFVPGTTYKMAVDNYKVW